MFESLPLISIQLTFVITALLLGILIFIQRKNRLFQFIRPEGPASHHAKGQTVTAGGLAIIVGQVTFLWWNSNHLFTNVYCLSLILFGILGLADDILKITDKGMRSRTKFLGQCLISIYILSSFISTHYPLNLVFTQSVIPFWGKVALPPILLMTLNFFAHISTANAINLTDGQDGLLTQILIGLWSVITILFLLSFAYKAQLLGAYPLEPFVFIGLANLITLSAFLCFNHYPAKIFMGDCGSLALGGSLATSAMMMLFPLGLLFIAIIPLIETLSVIIQVLSFKITGNRVFKMAPIHHHFELSGYHETTVTYRFVMINTILSLFTITSYMQSMAIA